MEQINEELLLKQLREHLNKEKIKLWEPPYTKEDGCRGEIPEDLISQLSGKTGFSCDEVSGGIETLRCHALTKLAEREKFQTQGLATLRVKLSLPQASEQKTRKIPVECSLNANGLELRSLLATQFDIPAEQIKVICKGRVVDDDQSLLQQSVQNGNDVMVLCMSVSEAEAVMKEQEVAEVEKTRQAAALLSKREDDAKFDVQIADQNGQPLNLPRKEKQALTIAMTLHEKGKVCLRAKRVSQALLLFLESDSEFSKCSSNLLTMVDNYGILCLDIVWCYLLLKNLEQLPDAEWRLSTCESCFKRSYGEKMERLAKIKGGTGEEQALFMRLYLLQGVVAFHKGEIADAQNLFRRADFVLSLLHVDDNKLNEVMIMGFTEREARLALRAKNGNIQQAVDHIVQKRKEKEEISKRAKKDWKQRLRGKKLGKTAAGEPVRVEFYENLLNMGFPPGAASEALKQSNNNISTAIEILNTRPDLFNLPDPERRDNQVEITPAMVQQIASLGFLDINSVKNALRAFNGDIQLVAEELLRNGGAFPAPSDSSSSVSTESDSSPTRDRRREMEEEQLDELVSDISQEEMDDHLDLALTEEKEMLSMYQGMANSVGSSN